MEIVPPTCNIWTFVLFSNSAVMYSPSCCSKAKWHSFFRGLQKKIFRRMLGTEQFWLMLTFVLWNNNKSEILLKICSTVEKWGWVNGDRIIFFRWTFPLARSQNLTILFKPIKDWSQLAKTIKQLLVCFLLSVNDKKLLGINYLVHETRLGLLTKGKSSSSSPPGLSGLLSLVMLLRLRHVSISILYFL